MTNPTEIALKVLNAHKSYGTFQALNDVNFEVHKGEIFGLLGPNGAGKSTLIKCIGGVSDLNQGDIRVFGHSVRTHPLESKALTGIMPQEIALENFFPLGRALEFHSGYYGVTDNPKWRQNLIEHLGLGPYLDKKPNQVSGGTKRRFMCAKALIHRPQLVILDEPTAGVDVELRKQLWDFVAELRTQGFTILLTTHYIEEAEKMCDRIAIIQHGRLIALDSTSKLKASLNQDRVDFVFTQTPSQELIQKLKLTQGQHHKQWSVQIQEHQLCDLLDELNSNHMRFERMEIKKPSLEDVFLQLTSNGNGAL